MIAPNVEVEYSGGENGQWRVKLTLSIGTLTSLWFYNKRICEDVATRIGSLIQAEKVWSELATIVGCTSGDGFAELEQVRYYKELMKDQAEEIQALKGLAKHLRS